MLRDGHGHDLRDRDASQETVTGAAGLGSRERQPSPAAASVIGQPAFLRTSQPDPRPTSRETHFQLRREPDPPEPLVA
jgi:hypothetical protein